MERQHRHAVGGEAAARREVPRRLAADGRGRQGRADVKFHDGSPLTAEDVKAVYERNMVPGKTVVQSGFATLESVQAVNPTTLRIVTRKPDPLVPVRMAQMGGSIYPARFTSEDRKSVG